MSSRHGFMMLVVMGAITPLCCMLWTMWQKQGIIHQLMHIRDQYCLQQLYVDKALDQGVSLFIKKKEPFTLLIKQNNGYEAHLVCREAQELYPGGWYLQVKGYLNKKPGLSVACILIEREKDVLVDYYTLGTPVW